MELNNLTQRLINPSNDIPTSIHLLITSDCNLNCHGCFYRDVSGTLAYDDVIDLINHAAKIGVEWIAIGGGEPLLWLWLDDIIKYAQSRGVHVAITTNGQLKKDITPYKVNISHDTMHRSNLSETLDTLSWYVAQGVSIISINSILHPDDGVTLRDIKTLLDIEDVDSVIVLPPKPIVYNEIQKIAALIKQINSPKLYVDGCLTQILGHTCTQGRISFCIDQAKRASICSNTISKIPYDGDVLSTWNKLRLHSWDKCKEVG